MLTRTYPDGDAVGTPASPWLYDNKGQLKAIPGLISDVTYNARGQVLTTTYPNSVSVSHTYNDERTWLTRVLVNKTGTTHLDSSYTRGPTGRIDAITSPLAGDGWTYTYDDLDRLLSAVVTGGPTQTFAYDAVGNLTSNSALGAYLYPAPGGHRPHAPISVGGQTYTYDGNGSLLSGGGRTLTHDGERRPATVTVGGVVTTPMSTGPTASG